MKVKNRHDKIVDFVRKNSSATVEELATLLEISRETIRRDLTDLSKAGKVQKVHGGATLPRSIGEGSFQHRMSENVDAKIKIAQAAVELFSAGETLFIDTGTTTLYLAEKVAEMAAITVVTNSVEIASIASASRSTVQTFLLGGEFNASNRQTIGTMAAAQVRLFRAHHAVLTIGALDSRTGAMDFDIEEAQVARAMIEQSQSVTILVDSSKFNAVASFEVCQLSQIDRLITDAAPSAGLADAIEAAGVELIVAG